MTHRRTHGPWPKIALMGALLAASALASPGLRAQTGTGTGLGTGEAAAPASPVAPAPPGPSVDVDALDIDVAGPEGEVTVGEPVVVTLSVTLPPGVRLDTVESVDPGHLEFDDRDIDHLEVPSGGVRATARIVYIAYRPGTHRIEAFDVRFRFADGTTVTRRVPGVEVPVRSLIANEQNPELRPEKGGIPVLYRDYTLAWVAGIGGALLAMGLIGFVIARSRPREVHVVPLPPPRPAHEIAFEKLDAIKQEQLIERGELMDFYVRLSEALREYLGNRYGFEGLEMTTTEILAQLHGAPLPASHDRTKVAHLLYACDLVKFAKGASSASEEREALEEAYHLVESTMFVPVVAEPAPGPEPAPEPEPEAEAEPEEGRR